MPTWAKVLLGIGCGIGLLVIAGIAAGYFFINSHKDHWVAEGKKVQDEGRTYAAGKTANDCVDESIRRLHTAGGILGEVRVRVFLRGCIDAAAELPERIEGDRRRPRADRDVGQHGMQRMSEPRSVQKVFELALHRRADEFLNRLRRFL